MRDALTELPERSVAVQVTMLCPTGNVAGMAELEAPPGSATLTVTAASGQLSCAVTVAPDISGTGAPADEVAAT